MEQAGKGFVWEREFWVRFLSMTYMPFKFELVYITENDTSHLYWEETEQGILLERVVVYRTMLRGNSRRDLSRLGDCLPFDVNSNVN